MAKSIEQCKAEHPKFCGVARIEAAGIDVAFRKPTAREWQDFDVARTAWGTTVAAGTVNHAVTKEMFERSEELCVRLIVSHDPQELQDLNDEHLGIFFGLAQAISDQIDKLRSGAGKGSTKPGGA